MQINTRQITQGEQTPFGLMTKSKGRHTTQETSQEKSVINEEEVGQKAFEKLRNDCSGISRLRKQEFNHKQAASSSSAATNYKE